MKQNMLITSYDYALSRRISEKLAEEFSMRYMDEVELFEFDHIPFTFAEIYRKNGEEYINKKFRSIMKMELDFDGVVFSADMSFADTCEDFLYRIKLSNFVILLCKDDKSEEESLAEKKYNSPEEKRFCCVDRETLMRRKGIIKRNCADISIDISGLSDESVVDEVKEQIKKYYRID